MSATARKLIDHTPRDADQIAAAVVSGIDPRRFLILPDPDARKAFRMKRLARPFYDRTMFGMGRRTATLRE
ncbi:hypothetical protein [Nocardia stercoris]|uniref:Short-chain dehydrogenase n=1 Tax=Nocardia stercoris TaxID=2483361 RepID=A0A3M2L9C3_9NOCA|nr:hypothetical protein [Nocardia stercoris]RMI33310.1 hypothetical protein EBN03_09040 [Nocardia stercoris]